MRYLFIIVAIVGTLTYSCGNVIDVFDQEYDRTMQKTSEKPWGVGR